MLKKKTLRPWKSSGRHRRTRRAYFDARFSMFKSKFPLVFSYYYYFSYIDYALYIIECVYIKKDTRSTRFRPKAVYRHSQRPIPSPDTHHPRENFISNGLLPVIVVARTYSSTRTKQCLERVRTVTIVVGNVKVWWRLRAAKCVWWPSLSELINSSRSTTSPRFIY